MSLALHYLSRWSRWRDRLNNTTFNHGSELVLELGTPRDGKPGLTDNVYVAETILRDLEERGLIRREKYAPTSQQRFMGVNGGWTDNLMARSLTTYGWSRGPRVITPEVLGEERSK